MPRATVLYDGLCAFCRHGVRTVRRLDWLGRLRFQDAHDVANLPACAEPLVPHKLLEEMHLVTPDGTHAHAGYRAFRWMAWRLPLLWPVAPLLYLPGVPWLGNRVYRWVARNRYKLVPCAHGACQVVLPRK